MKKTVSKKEKREIRIKKSIIRSAKQLFSLKGYKDTTIDEITDKALIAKATLYHYFKSKENLFLETILDSEKNLFQLLDQKITQNQDMNQKQKFQALLFYMLNYFEKDYYLVHLIFYREDYFNKEIIDFIKLFMNRTAGFLSKFLSGFEKITPDESEKLAVSIMGAVYVNLIYWYTGSRKEGLKEVGKTLFNQFYPFIVCRLKNKEI